jgi:methyltransferase family protein
MDRLVDLISRLAGVAVRAKRQRKPAEPVRLNLGSGPLHDTQGWIGIDASIHLLVRWLPERLLRRLLRHTNVGEQAAAPLKQGQFLFGDLRYGIRFADKTVEAVYSSHMLEHLTESTAELVLAESRRVLIGGDVLRLAVPVDDGSDDPRERTGRLLHVHRSRWTWPKLEAALHTVGFVAVERKEFREGRCPDLRLLEHRAGSTLFVEATATPNTIRSGSGARFISRSV